MSDDLLLNNLKKKPTVFIEGVPTGGLSEKQPIVDMRIVMFGKMMVHPQTKEMVMVPMQDVQYKRAGSEKWFSMPIEEVQNHEIKPEG
jgi:hypothetical protein